MNTTTIEDRSKLWLKEKGIEGETFEDLRAHLSSRTQASLRRSQIAAALEGNTAMLIFLGKQLLGQVDDYRGNNSSTWEEEEHTTISQSELVRLLRASREIEAKS